MWDAIFTLAENEGITFDACLGLTLQVLNLLLQVPTDISFQTQIPLTIAYCPESSVYRRWCPEQGGVSPLCKKIRASHTPSKVLGRVTCQPSESAGGPPSPAPSDHSTGSGGSPGSRRQSCSRARSITPARSRRSGSVGSVASHHSVHSHVTEDGEVTSSESESSQDKGDSAEEDKGGIETSSDGQEASDGEDRQEHPHTQDTLTGVSQLFGEHEDTDQESDAREKAQSIQQKWHPKSPKEDSPWKDSSESSSSEEEPPTNEALCDWARLKAWLLDTCFDAWCCDKIANGIAGWVTRDTLTCDLPEHGKMQPNHPDPMRPPLDYMGECRVFNGIWLDLYDSCCFYALGTTGDPPEFPMPWEPVSHCQVRDLLKSAHSIGQPHLILVHSADSVMAVSMLWELHTAAYLWCLQVDLWDKSIVLPLLHIHGRGGNDLSYLNHIIISHYNASYGCGKCLKQAFV